VNTPTDPPAVDLDLVDGLVQLSFVIQSLLARLGEPQALSTTQVRLLAVLEDRQIGMLQLAAILELEKSSVTGLVDRAVRRGLVQRLEVPGNRRAVHVTTTDAGRELMAGVREQVRAELAELLGSFTGPQQRRFAQSVRTLIGQYVDLRAIPLD